MKKTDDSLIIPYWAKWMLGIVLSVVIGLFANEMNITHTQGIKNTENIKSNKEDLLEIKQDGKDTKRMVIQMLSARGITPDTTVTEKTSTYKKRPFKLAQY